MAASSSDPDIDETRRPATLSSALTLLRVGQGVVQTMLNRHPRLCQDQQPVGVLPHRFLLAHGASAGDVAAVVGTAEPVSRALGLPLVLTAITDTGLARAIDAVRSGRAVCAAPLPIAAGNELERLVANAAAVIVERLELWPLLLDKLAEHRTPWVLHNGHLSEQSALGYARLHSWWPWLLRSLCLARMLDESSAARFVNLAPGLEAKTVIGPSSKLWVTMPPTSSAAKARYHLDRPWVVAGSVSPDDVEVVMSSCHGLWTRCLAVPRYPERDKIAIADRCRAAGHDTRLASDGVPQDWTGVVVVDAFGELSQLYTGADWAIIGGTFDGRGGHNPVEPWVCGTPVLVGPDTSGIDDLLAPMSESGAVVRLPRVGPWPAPSRPADNDVRAALNQARGRFTPPADAVVAALRANLVA